MAESLKKKAFHAVIWNALQKYGTLVISFATNIVLARLLSVNDFGVIGVLSVFISIASSITESGFNSALIQRKNVTQVDYCTAFYWNLSLSIILIIILFFLAPLIAQYFNQPILTPILRVQSITLFINSLCLVQTAKLMKELKFKTLAVRNIGAYIVSSVVGISLALLGFGVWSLVWQVIAAALVGAILLWSVADWKPSFNYSWDSFKNMFKFGGYVFISVICNTLYINFLSFIIGKAFSIKDLGYYTQAKKLEQVPIEGTASVLNAVLFPVFSSVSDDHERHLAIVRKNMTLISYSTFPIMLLLVIIAPYIIPIMYGSKWDNSIPMFQILCIMGFLTPINNANVTIFRSLGRGGIYLTIQLIKYIIGLILIIFSLRWGLYVMLWTMAIISFITYVVNIIFSDRLYGYKWSQQLYDIIPNFILTIIVGLISYISLKIISLENMWISLIISLSIFSLLYILGSRIFKMKGFYMLINLRKLRKN